jgi:hypothetical protein
LEFATHNRLLKEFRLFMILAMKKCQPAPLNFIFKRPKKKWGRPIAAPRKNKVKSMLWHFVVFSAVCV